MISDGFILAQILPKIKGKSPSLFDGIRTRFALLFPLYRRGEEGVRTKTPFRHIHENGGKYVDKMHKQNFS